MKAHASRQGALSEAADRSLQFRSAFSGPERKVGKREGASPLGPRPKPQGRSKHYDYETSIWFHPVDGPDEIDSKRTERFRPPKATAPVPDRQNKIPRRRIRRGDKQIPKIISKKGSKRNEDPT